MFCNELVLILDQIETVHTDHHDEFPRIIMHRHAGPGIPLTWFDKHLTCIDYCVCKLFMFQFV